METSLSPIKQSELLRDNMQRIKGKNIKLAEKNAELTLENRQLVDAVITLELNNITLTDKLEQQCSQNNQLAKENREWSTKYGQQYNCNKKCLELIKKLIAALQRAEKRNDQLTACQQLSNRCDPELLSSPTENKTVKLEQLLQNKVSFPSKDSNNLVAGITIESPVKAKPLELGPPVFCAY